MVASNHRAAGFGSGGHFFAGFNGELNIFVRTVSGRVIHLINRNAGWTDRIAKKLKQAST